MGIWSGYGYNNVKNPPSVVAPGESEKDMLSDRIDKTVYTKNADGTSEKWYLEKILNDGTCFLRKSAKPKWIDAKRFFKSSGVYENKKDCLNGEISISV